MSNKNYEEVFCKNVKQLRKQNYHSRKIMAEKLGISVYALTMIETGRLPKRLTLDVLFSIEENFGITCTDMFKEDSIKE